MAVTKKAATPAKTTSAPAGVQKAPATNQHVVDLAFGKENYILMITGIVFIIVGFILMSGGKVEDPTAFNPEIFSFRRITLAPVVVTIGFIIEVVAIVKKSKE